VQGLRDGETVLVLYPDELQAIATVESEMEAHVRYWYAWLPNRDAIENIHPEALAEHNRHSR